MHVAALGFGIGSVQALAVQFDPPVAHPQATPAFVVIAMHAESEFKL
mgnify:CR=1 FL=1